MRARTSVLSANTHSSPPGTPPWRDFAVRLGRAAGVLVVVLAASEPAPADACGGAFFEASAPDTVAVRGHQMAVAISKKQTVVWDRIEVDGDPSEVAWVIPVRDGAKLELSSEKWFQALANHTAASVQDEGTTHESGGGGCACGAGDGALADTVSTGRGSDVTVLERADVGPYETARLRATEAGAARTWLVGHGFRIPDDIGPVLDQYTSEGFDFIALRVRPGGAAVGLQPLRLTTPGADPTLPLRMSRAGVKSHAELTLFVIGEGRYRVQGFEELAVDRSKLTYNRATAKSNYDAVLEQQLAGGDGRHFVVEHATDDPTGLASSGFRVESSCIPSATQPSLGGGQDAGPSPFDAGDTDAGDVDAGDGGDVDAGADAGEDGGGADGGEDAAPDAGDDDASRPPPPSPLSVTTCATSDLSVARDGMSGALWVTRLRAKLPASAFASDLRFEASPVQESVSSNYVVMSGGGAMVARVRPSGAGSMALFGVTLAGLLAMLGKRRRRS